jgi:hypothetical protein
LQKVVQQSYMEGVGQQSHAKGIGQQSYMEGVGQQLYVEGFSYEFLSCGCHVVDNLKCALHDTSAAAVWNALTGWGW